MLSLPETSDQRTLEALLQAPLMDRDLLADLPDAFALPAGGLTPGFFAPEPVIPTQRYLEPTPAHPVAVRYDCFEYAADLVRAVFPLPCGARAHAVCSGQFVAGDLIEAAAVQEDWLIDDLWIGTLSLNAANIDSLANLYHGDYLRSLHLLVSQFWYVHNRRGDNNLLAYAYRELDPPEPSPDTPPEDRRTFQLAVTGSHAKLILIATRDGGRYVLHGSANLRSAACIEILTIEHSPALYDFHRSWCEALATAYRTINHATPNPHQAHPLRKRTQWQHVRAAAAPTPAAAPTTPDAPPSSVARPTAAEPPVTTATAPGPGTPANPRPSAGAHPEGA